nr:leucine-rich repeat domain-containing protein [Lachnospiraceae bacterium]
HGSHSAGESVYINGVSYKVISVAKSAFSNNKKAVSATVGKNVKKIGKDAFRGCKKLKKIFIKTKKLKRVGKNAFCGITKGAQIKVPKKKYVVYRKMLAKKGQRSTVKIRY